MRPDVCFSLIVLLSSCAPQGEATTSDVEAAYARFERNAETARQLILDFDAESDAALAHFADSAVWTPTRFGQTDTVPLEQAWAGWKRAWAAYDMALLSDIVLLPGVDPVTNQVDGSVRVYFDWAYTRAAYRQHGRENRAGIALRSVGVRCRWQDLDDPTLWRHRRHARRVAGGGIAHALAKTQSRAPF